MKFSLEIEKAAFKGEVNKVQRLLDDGANIDSVGQNWNPLHAAIENEQISVVELLLYRGADVEAVNGGMTPLEHAVDISIDGTTQSGGQPGDEPIEVIQLLLGKGVDRRSALVLAQKYANQRVIELLDSRSK